jgi:hypothetical protein
MSENSEQKQARQGNDRPDSRNPEESKAAGSPSVEDLARRLLDLWQEQMAAMAADPDLMRQMGLMMSASPLSAMLQGIVQGMMNGAPATGGGSADSHSAASPSGGPNSFAWWKPDAPRNPDTSRPSQKPEARPAAAAPASRPGGGELAELRRRLAGLEARLQELGAAGKRIVAESGPSGEPQSGSRKPAAKPRRRKSTAKPAGKVAGAARRGGRGGSGGAGDGAAG